MREGHRISHLLSLSGEKLALSAIVFYEILDKKIILVQKIHSPDGSASKGPTQVGR
jgi:predicted ester cyclase